jgi:hypothetical protein
MPNAQVDDSARECGNPPCRIFIVVFSSETDRGPDDEDNRQGAEERHVKGPAADSERPDGTLRDHQSKDSTDRGRSAQNRRTPTPMTRRDHHQARGHDQ